MRFSKNEIFSSMLLLFMIISFSEAAAQPKWSRLPYKKSRVEGVGVVAVRDFPTVTVAIEQAKERARIELQRHFRDDRQAQIKLLGTTIELTSIAWSNIILYNSTVNYKVEKTGEIEMVYAYAFISKGSNSPYVAALFSSVYPGLGQIYNEEFSIVQTFLGTVSAAAAIYGQVRYKHWLKKYNGSQDFDEISDYHDKSGTALNVRNIALGFYGIMALYSAVDAYRDARSAQDSRDIFRSVYQNRNGGLRFRVIPTRTTLLFGFGINF